MITLTPKAASEVKRIIADQSLPEGTALRLGVRGGGCSGFSYSMGLDETVAATDKVMEKDGVKVVVDEKSLMYLDGTEVDFNDGIAERGFVFRNPNATKSCGCGSSFTA